MNYPAILNITPLAQCWLKLIKEYYPQDWSSLVPELDFGSADRKLKAKALPVLSFLPALMRQSSANFHELIQAMSDIKSSLHFGQSYTPGDFGEEFIQQYGWLKLIGPDAYWHSDSISSGFVILGDSITYPQHWHDAEELYMPISGMAEWYHADSGWQLKPPGSLIHHQSNIKHAMRTNGEPLMALYIWRGGNLIQKSEHI